MKRVMIVLGIVGVLAIGLFAVAAAGAQEDVADEVTRPVDDLVSRVAEKLGVSEDEFVAAWNESAIEIIDEKVAAGELDAETAEILKQRIEEADGIVLPPGPRHKDHHPFLRGLMLIGQAAQNVLGTEDGELREAFQNGQSLLDVALEKGFTEEQFKTDLLAEVQSILDEKVDEGAIDQETADAAYARIAENIDTIINKTRGDGPPVHGLGFGPRGFGPGPIGSEPPVTDEETSTTDA